MIIVKCIMGMCTIAVEGLFAIPTHSISFVIVVQICTFVYHVLICVCITTKFSFGFQWIDVFHFGHDSVAAFCTVY